MRFDDSGTPGIKVTTQEEAESAEFVICGPDSFFKDDVKTFCTLCAAPIVHRPHAPKKAQKICLRCGSEMMRGDESPVIMTTEQSLKEAKAYIFRH